MATSEITTILVVDDDALIRDIIGMVLEDQGYAIQKAKDGGEAIRKHQAEPVDLIVSDMNMPEVDGLELIKRIRATGDTVPVIILTGNSEIATAIEALHSGASDYLLKDENIQDTVTFSVEKVLEKQRLQAQNKQLMTDLARKNELLEKDKVLAQKVQKNILPRDLVFPSFEVSTFYQPSDKIGGDFFDAWEAEGKINLVIADVSGHSTSSALIMAVCKGIIRSVGQIETDIKKIVTAANRMLCEVLTDSGMFISLVYGIIDREKEELQLLSAGHNPVFLSNGGTTRAIESMGPVIGWDPDDDWDLETFPFPGGSGLFMYTDGITEAKDRHDEEFGEERLETIIQEGQPPEQLIETIFAAAREFCHGDFPDDLTMFAIRKN
ncbi:MAG: SpoIIE family protein phosphatase [Proteobacteria bacterium]|nr:SpoIIE family protein phosphatase [Pseudomonadota bacterium]MBU1687305.1 SpoIIE family protein phosphatase [Pseudomonadota bacterium]